MVKIIVDLDKIKKKPAGRTYYKKLKSGGRFMCPECKEHFSLRYSVFGRRNSLAENEHFCRDCARQLSLIRAD